MTTVVNGTGRRIKTHEATVKTAAVYVKALMIEKHQVTLAVFRQLRNQDLVDLETAKLAGQPWGTVNYHPSTWGCPPEDQHLHLVWQNGDELRRAAVRRGWPGLVECQEHVNELTIDARDAAARWAICQVLDGQPVKLVGDSVHVPVGLASATFVLVVPLDTHHFSADYMLRVHIQHVLRGVSLPDYHRDAIRKWLGAVDAAYQMNLVREDLEAAQDWKQRAEAGAARWAKQYAALEQLDQLFIAV